MSHVVAADPHFQEGLALFNQGSFWHAHEAWETLWLRSEGDTRAFVQGLIQVAAALVHWERGNRRGLQLNWAKAWRNLEGLPSPFAGFDLALLRAWMEGMISGEVPGAPTLPLKELP